MSAYDYLSTPVSIILGLAAAYLLSSAYRLILFRANVRFYWLPLIWTVLMVLGIAQWWWGLYGLRYQSEWTYFCVLPDAGNTSSDVSHQRNGFTPH